MRTCTACDLPAAKNTWKARYTGILTFCPYGFRAQPTELYYISGDRALAKKVWQKTWRISIPKIPPLGPSKVPGFMLLTTDHSSGACWAQNSPPPDSTLTFEGTRSQTVILKRSEIVLQATVTARICHICTSTIFCCSIQDKIQTISD